MIIYDVENFPNPLRVRIALAEKNALDSVTFKPVDLMNGEHRSAAFLRKTPFAGVPVIEWDDGTYLAECPAITEYIDHHFAGPSLTGETAKERAVISMMQRRAEAGDKLDELAADGLIGTTGTVWTPDGRLVAAGSSQLFCRPRPERFR